MNETLRLGTVAGIRIGVNWSVLVIFALLLVGLSAGRFPLLYPDHSTLTYAAAGTIAALVFFLSLLAHELAHALVAQREGVSVEGITLWLFGGVAKLQGEPADPGADLRIAAVGPLVSLLLGGGFGLLAAAAAVAGVDGITLGVLAWLSFINVLLAVFNLIPAAPLDGGRVLRALLWRRYDDRVRAAVTAARAGRRFGAILIGLGVAVVLLLPGVGLGGLWFALIGWFIASAAAAEEQHARVRGSLENVRVGAVMTPAPTTVPVGLPVDALIDDYVLRRRHSSYPIVDTSGRPLGLVTLQGIRDLATEARSRTSVEQIGTSLDQLATARPEEALIDVLPRLTGSTTGRLLVLDDTGIVGIVAASDVARAMEIAEVTGASS